MNEVTKHLDLPNGVSIEVKGPEDAVEAFLRKMTDPPPAPFNPIIPWVIERPALPNPHPWNSPWVNTCGTANAPSNAPSNDPLWLSSCTLEN